MARKPRIEYEGAHYPVMSRGDRREAIFYDDEDRNDFLRTLGGVCEWCGWRAHAYVLMNNHYHLLLETPQPNLVKGALVAINVCDIFPIENGSSASGEYSL